MISSQRPHSHPCMPDSKPDQAASQTLADTYRRIRQRSEALCQPLVTEDYVIQSIPEVSPPKWHLAHVSWFFEAFILSRFVPGYRPYHPQFAYLFNSYYESLGEFWPRPQRGLLSRPTVEEIYRYRASVDAAMLELLQQIGNRLNSEQSALLTELLILGLNHEQQHQELLLMDIKFNFAQNPLRPAYRDTTEFTPRATQPMTWHEFEGGVCEIGHQPPGFAYDNEHPRHRVYLQPFRLASRLVTNAEYRAFLDDSGYRRPEFWLADGWAQIRQQARQAPLYWDRAPEGQPQDAGWLMTLSGLRPIDPAEPVCHLSFYEADAYARWAGKRLPSEAEWEVAANRQPLSGNFYESGYLHPRPAKMGSDITQMCGDLWEWTETAYRPYPGFKPLAGAPGEYNGKFMANQMVLRGGCCITPADHIRTSYRNFFYPHDRWQFAGLRLADST